VKQENAECLAFVFIPKYFAICGLINYLLLVEGKRLPHPELEAGTRSRMKILRVNPSEDLALTTIEEILGTAFNLYKNGR
jgi:hypothetical protein